MFLSVLHNTTNSYITVINYTCDDRTIQSSSIPDEKDDGCHLWLRIRCYTHGPSADSSTTTTLMVLTGEAAGHVTLQ